MLYVNKRFIFLMKCLFSRIFLGVEIAVYPGNIERIKHQFNMLDA